MPPQASQALRAEKAETEVEPTQRNPEKATASEKITADFLEAVQTYTKNLCLLMAAEAAVVQNTVAEQVRAEEEGSLLYLVENILQSAAAAVTVPTQEVQSQLPELLLAVTVETAAVVVAVPADAGEEITFGVQMVEPAATAPTAATARTAYC